MGNPTPPESVKLIASIICRAKESFSGALERVIDRWGSVDFISERLEFDYTDYYEKEMGSHLWRKIVSFEGLIGPDRIASVKYAANAIEASLSAESGGRVVNIDPGYLNSYHLMLATTKPGPHRPYLQNGMYADLTLIFREKSFRALPWTYPDYQSDIMTAIMNVLRQKYLFQLRKGHCSASGN
jgi:hypothetical protein